MQIKCINLDFDIDFNAAIQIISFNTQKGNWLSHKENINITFQYNSKQWRAQDFVKNKKL